MTTDRTTKNLLAVIAVALSLIALRPYIGPMEARAQEPSSVPPAFLLGSNVWVAAPANQSGRVYRFKSELGKPIFIGEYGPGVKPE